MMVWNPEQYDKYEALRWRPAHDLVEALPPLAPRKIFDLGCGTGRLARLLADRWPDAAVTGIDGSAAMLAKAAAVPSRVQWRPADLEVWQPERPVDVPVDLIVSNAALHWLPDHAALVTRLVDWLAEGGVLAVQMPCNEAAPSHELLRATAAEPAFKTYLADIPSGPRVHPASAYYNWLSPLC